MFTTIKNTLHFFLMGERERYDWAYDLYHDIAFYKAQCPGDKIITRLEREQKIYGWVNKFYPAAGDLPQDNSRW